MPIFKQETKQIELPDSKAKITMLEKVNYGTMIKIWDYEKLDNPTALEVITTLIIDWDLTDEKGEKLPINSETIKKLSVKDGQFLIEEFSAYFKEKKTLV
jgi:uncharacterized protein YccT (UPF0319 family)